MAVQLDPMLLELTQSGTTARMLLGAQERLIGICVENVLRKIDTAVAKGDVDEVFCVGVVHQLAAFRHILYRHRQDIDVGDNAARRAQERSQ